MTITSIGYGDIRAPDGNTHEQVFATILMLLGGMIWGMIIATFCGVISNLDPAGTEFRTTMDNLNRFMALQGLPQEMRQSLREYFHQTKHLQIARANKLLIENMSPMLQGMPQGMPHGTPTNISRGLEWSALTAGWNETCGCVPARTRHEVSRGRSL